ncbi:hypothetical protein EGR_05692 [Echinococcus granulosus]|uniref:Uncharacterized protein n=1 Tax=Echinococcus granulosus TaxID=6210 RepID=W6UF09_ECHGR|nr:hypothetical protein EGR_05692 [Echinococcus granulosus]EUB59441.1 hypothetical protein EGR_05692 [Echinococcus granulosus]
MEVRQWNVVGNGRSVGTDPGRGSSQLAELERLNTFLRNDFKVGKTGFCFGPPQQDFRGRLQCVEIWSHFAAVSPAELDMCSVAISQHPSVVSLDILLYRQEELCIWDRRLITPFERTHEIALSTLDFVVLPPSWCQAGCESAPTSLDDLLGNYVSYLERSLAAVSS